MSCLNPFPRSLRSLSLGLFGVLPLAASAQNAQVYFEQRDRTLLEYQSVEVYVAISRATPVDVEVPFRISDESTATFIVDTDDDGEYTDEDGDFYIEEDTDEDDDNNLLFDPATKSGILTLPAGARKRAFTIYLNNDYTPEETETIIIEMIKDQVTVATPVNPSTQTLFIQDDDTLAEDGSPYGPYHAWFESLSFSVDEGGSVSIPIRLRGRSIEPLDITWEFAFDGGTGSASGNDIDLTDDEDTVDDPFTLSVGSSVDSSSILIQTYNDNLVEGTETFYVKISEMTLDEDSEYEPVPTFTVDTRRVRVDIIDNDPTTVSMDFSDDYESLWEGRTIDEAERYAITVTLSETLEEDVIIPVTLGGTAIRGDDNDTKDFDYYPSPDPADNDETIIISAGDLTSSMTIVTFNDTIEESDETVIITLGTPTMEDSGTVLAFGTDEGQTNTYTVTIADNDPVDFGFGTINPLYYDEDLTAEDLLDVPVYVPDTNLVVSERSGQVSIPIYLSGYAADDTDFEIEVVSSGTTASLYDFDLDADEQDWDFYLSNILDLQEMDTPTETTLGGSSLVYSLTVVLNNDVESALPYAQLATYLAGGTLPDDLQDIEGDETILFRITAITNDSDSGVSLRTGYTEFTLTIKETPDIDLTDVIEQDYPQTDNWVDGAPPRNPRTGLHEIHYYLNLPDDVIANLHTLIGSVDDEFATGVLRGYNALRVAFQPGVYDVDNPDASTNDVILPSTTPDGVTSFYYTVNAPYKPYYPTTTSFVTIREGAEQVKENIFTEENADIYLPEYSVLQAINFGHIDPDPLNGINHREDYFDIGDPMDFLIEFSNRGRYAFDLDRLDRSIDPNNMRVLLSRLSSFPSRSRSALSGQFLGFDELDDGRISIKFFNSTATDYNVEYLNEDGEWEIAQPGLAPGGSNTIIWEDTGPPKTYPHPREVEHRLYRISNQ